MSEQTPIKRISTTVCVPVVISAPNVFLVRSFFFKLRICLLDLNFAQLHNYTHQLSINHFKIANQPKSAS